MIEFFKEFPFFGYIVIALVAVMAVVVYLTIRTPRERIDIDGLVNMMRANKPLKRPPPKHRSKSQSREGRSRKGFDNDSISWADSE